MSITVLPLDVDDLSALPLTTRPFSAVLSLPCSFWVIKMGGARLRDRRYGIVDVLAPDAAIETLARILHLRKSLAHGTV